MDWVRWTGEVLRSVSLSTMVSGWWWCVGMGCGLESVSGRSVLEKTRKAREGGVVSYLWGGKMERANTIGWSLCCGGQGIV